MSVAIELYAQMIGEALPFAIVFSVGNLIVTSFLKAAFRGHLEI